MCGLLIACAACEIGGLLVGTTLFRGPSNADIVGLGIIIVFGGAGLAMNIWGKE